MNSNFAKKASIVLGVSSVAVSAGNISVQAGPALQTLNNRTNTAEFTINNTYVQSFSVDGIISSALIGTGGGFITPFALAGTTAVGASFNAQSATLTTGFVGDGMGDAMVPVATVAAEATIATFSTAATMLLNVATAGLGGIALAGTTGTQTIGASISSTLFGPSTVKATTSFTNQLINDLSAF